MTHRAWGLLLVANLVGIAAAGRRHGPTRGSDWAPPKPTSTKAFAGLTNSYHPHQTTEAPSLPTLADLRRRQSDSSICGYFPGLADPFACPDGWTCTNIGNHRDCCLGAEYCTAISAFSTECVNWDHAACSTSRPGTMCCSAEDGYPYCRTYLYSTTATPDQSFSILVCEAVPYTGIATILATSPTSLTSSITTVSPTSPTSTASATTGPSDHSSTPVGAPVGAIVGGIVGGLAIIGIVTLGIFYMFFRSRRKAEVHETGASAAFIKHEQPPAAAATPPAYKSLRPNRSSQRDGSRGDSQEFDDQQPLIPANRMSIGILENSQAAATKNQHYTELPTNIYKSELPS
ncbi:hypothetical protein C8A00DRAFT_19524 [Chaetomidium leptoderma]|uniref:Mid2 domain-containing protein n=1 Tax=Chaetomidium leptoderma TaxID=669021 RepID=A0AAN6ZSR4_9PEZI|nr:hypothetical protein C8A00DRAFT_19524 [Chaetomidium leptoderma]